MLAIAKKHLSMEIGLQALDIPCSYQASWLVSLAGWLTFKQSLYCWGDTLMCRKTLHCSFNLKQGASH